MKRVMIVGGPGAGKSTLAAQLGEVTGLPVYHIDHIHYQAGWIERDSAVKSAMTNSVHAKDRWVFEGGHSVTYPQRLARADTFIWLDFPVWLRLYRVLRRTIRSLGATRPDLPAGCPGRLNIQTLYFLRFIWTTRNRSRKRLANIYQNTPPHVSAFRFNKRAALRRFLEQVKADQRGF